MQVDSMVAPSRSRLIDGSGRTLDYLRVSITDRCNLRCVYCLPADAQFPSGDRDFLSASEIEVIVRGLVRLGVRRVRLTGGEPLVRKDVLDIARRIKSIPGVLDLALSTNGTELARLARDLRAAGVDRVNVSLDSLDAETFRELTRRGDLAQVWEGIETALVEGFDPVKLNVVLMAPDTTHDQTEDLYRLAALTFDRPLSVRFIEMMTTDSNRHLTKDRAPTADDAKALLEERFGPLSPIAPRAVRTGPARAYRFDGALGEIGFITPLSHTFCADCNRLRLTARGELRLCLFAERNYPLRPCLTAPDPEQALETAILEALRDKPAEHLLHQGQSGNLKSFVQIGG
jgi:GTP 3',8-cyclase